MLPHGREYVVISTTHHIQSIIIHPFPMLMPGVMDKYRDAMMCRYSFFIRFYHLFANLFDKGADGLYKLFVVV